MAVKAADDYAAIGLRLRRRPEAGIQEPGLSRIAALIWRTRGISVI
jgi:hypothetical protein